MGQSHIVFLLYFDGVMVLNAKPMISRVLQVLLVCFLVAGCRVRDVRTFEIQVPKMQNQACADIILKALTPVPLEPGAVKIDLNRRVVTATYESLNMSRKNIEFIIADAGFAANDVPANKDAEAKLPEACKAAVTTAVAPVQP